MDCQFLKVHRGTFDWYFDISEYFLLPPFSVLVDESVDYNDPELTYIFKCSRGYHVDLLKALLTFRLANKKLARSSTKHCLFLGLQIKVSQQIDKNIACFQALQKVY